MWIVVIFTTIPFVRSLRKYFVARWPAELIGIGVILVGVVLCTAGLIFLRRRRRRLPVKDAAVLLVVTTVLVIWTWRLMGQPEEAVHFLQYGILGVLLPSPGYRHPGQLGFCRRRPDWNPRRHLR